MQVRQRRTPPSAASTGNDEPQDTTLLDLVQSLCDSTDDDGEVVAAVLDLLRTGRVRLCGNFRGHPIRDFF